MAAAAASSSASASASASAMARAASFAPTELDPGHRISRDLTICGGKLAAAGGLEVLDLFFQSMLRCAPEKSLTMLSKPSLDPQHLRRVAATYAEAVYATGLLLKELAGLVGEYCPEIGSVALAQSSPVRQVLWSAGLAVDSIISRDVVIIAPPEQETVSMRVHNKTPCLVFAIPDDPSMAEIPFRPFESESAFLYDLSIQNLARPEFVTISECVVVPVTRRGPDLRLAQLFRIAVHGVDLRDPSTLYDYVVANRGVFERMLDRTFSPAPPSGGGGGGESAAAAASTPRSAGQSTLKRTHRRFLFAGGTSLAAVAAGGAAAAAAAAGGGGGGGGGGGAAAAATADTDVVEPSAAKRAKTTPASPPTNGGGRTPDPMDVDTDAETQVNGP